MKITKTQLKQIIKEELARLTEADWDHPPEPAGSLGGYGDTDLYADPNERGSEEDLRAALDAAEPPFNIQAVLGAAAVAAEAARKAALDADPYSQTADAVVYNAIIEYFRSKSQR